MPQISEFPRCCGMQIITGFTTVRLIDPDVPVGPPPVRFTPTREEVSRLPNRLVRRILRSWGQGRILDSDKAVSAKMRENAYHACRHHYITPEGALYVAPRRYYGKTLSQERIEVENYLKTYTASRGVTLIALNVYQCENIGDIVEKAGFERVVTAGNPLHGSWKADGGPRTVSLYIRNEQPEPLAHGTTQSVSSLFSR